MAGPPEPAPERLGGRRAAYAAGTAALVVAVLVIALSVLSAERGGSESTGPPTGAGVTGTAATSTMLDGIPQRGNVLGSPTAPVRLVEFADPQCPFCAVYARDVLPTVVREYVRTGKVQLVFRGLAFLGPGSVTALRTATAAASEHRMWNVLELLFRNQGPENAWVTDELLRSIVVAAGADADRVVGARDGADVGSEIDAWAREARTAGVNSVPAFFVARRGGPLQPLVVSKLAPPEFRAALDAALEK